MDVEKYWNTIASRVGDSRKWNDLERQLQDLIIDSVNRLIFVLSTGDGNST